MIVRCVWSCWRTFYLPSIYMSISSGQLSPTCESNLGSRRQRSGTCSGSCNRDAQQRPHVVRLRNVLAGARADLREGTRRDDVEIMTRSEELSEVDTMVDTVSHTHIASYRSNGSPRTLIQTPISAVSLC
jgi:hypothetical protein